MPVFFTFCHGLGSSPSVGEATSHFLPRLISVLKFSMQIRKMLNKQVIKN